MITSNRRIFLAIFLSLVIFFGIKYAMDNPQTFRPENILAKITSIKLPDFSNFMNFTNFLTLKTNNETMKQLNNGNNSFTLPTINQAPTGTRQPIPTKIIRIPTQFNRAPTGARPTKIPKPTSPPPITSDARPGNNLEEIFKEVNKRICIPVALLRAFQEEESGLSSWIPFNTPSSTIQKYNTYGWWKTGTADPCFSFAYDLKTGIVPSDSVGAGSKCPLFVSAANPGTMGIFMLDQWEQETSRKNTVAFLPNNIDRRVMFDNTLIFASITVNRVTEPECGEDWPDDVVRLAAEKHHGACQWNYGNGSFNYCDDILSLYKKYR